ncbi:alpha/beta fold hydrolase [Bradyrhizobium sp. F1.4.3]|uniref:alpha/beta fold hydrolase n=1 Tax=Bradyrhizobium sp. F1.4.3 TaxID=3156356 RepID=UPI003393F885
MTLPLAVLKDSFTDANLTPVFYFPGGPGSSSLDMSENTVRSRLQVFRPHPVVVIESRGLKLATPVLDCPGWYSRKYAPKIYGLEGLRERIKERSDLVTLCYETLKSQGVDVRAYTDYHITRDYDEIRKALGFQTIDIYGISTGGGSVATYLKYYGDHVRSAIFAFPWLTTLRDRPQFDELITAKNIVNDILGICVRDNAECAKRFPGYLHAADRARAILDAKPYVTTVASQVEPDGKLKIKIDGATFLSTLYYAGNPDFPSIYDRLPQALGAIFRGDYSALDQYFGLNDVDTRSPHPYAIGHFLSNVCGSMGQNEQTPKEATAMIEREPALMGYETNIFCAWWPEAGDVPASLNTTPVSNVPALAIHGQVDACCNIRWSQLLAETMPKLQRVVLQAQEHGGSGGGCRDKLIVQFLKSPNDPVDDSCKNTVPLRPWIFYTPTNTHTTTIDRTLFLS